MKKIVFTIANRRLEVDLEEEFAEYLFEDLSTNQISLEEDNEISQILQLYLKSLHREYKDEKHIKILLNNIEQSSW